MQIISKQPRKSLNKAYLKAGATQPEIQKLKSNLADLMKILDEQESEEHLKNDMRDFLSKTFFHDHYINTVGRTDLAIHLTKSNKSPAGVLIECKRPGNKAEMITRENINAKAMHEVILYYLRQRIEHNNNDIKHIIITNIYEWFIFDAVWFEKMFYRDKKLVKDYKTWAQNQKVSSNTDLFYKEIAAGFLTNSSDNIECTWFDLRSFAKLPDKPEKDKSFIPLLKILSPEHLLKLPFANDSNRLEKSFYYELLHIIGLEEHKEKSKKVIGRPDEKGRNPGSLLENTISILISTDKPRHVRNVEKYGETKEERLYNIALELNITWINRILFLKLLEAQLLKYHQGDNNFRFLNTKTIPDFDSLNELFFEVLAVENPEREPYLKDKFSRIPYLNSSLFEINNLEDATIMVSNLKDRFRLPLYSQTVLKDEKGRRRTGELPMLEYLFGFLDAYDFASEGSEEVRPESKSLINASVLGLIFEKINGYKEGSYFTPGFITMYMCRETIRKAVVQKFSDELNTSFNDFAHLKTEIDRTAEGRQQANKIINNLKICDPAVGSGHFLVSALNEIIAIKSELGVLSYSDGSRVQLFSVSIENDELIITDEETHEIFEYNVSALPDGKGWKAPTEKQRLQECLFHEKQTIIENCLFGVDINPNSVKICRLRLWIELLKNAYYKDSNDLETLPNIDINIKHGNSLISRFPLDADVSKLLRSKSKWDIFSYRLAVQTYREATNKEQKREMLRLIEKIKNDFRTEISRNDPKQKRLDKLGRELYDKYTGDRLLEVELTEKQKAREKRERQKLEAKIEKLSAEIKEIKENKIYLDAFEWRFEFPEVLDDDGDFIGFDVVIGNPPYIRQEEFSFLKKHLREEYKVYHSIADLLTYFVELSFRILNNNGVFQFIISNKFTRTNYGRVLRSFLVNNTEITHFIDLSGLKVFDEATVDAAVLGFCKSNHRENSFTYANFNKDEFDSTQFDFCLTEIKQRLEQTSLTEESWAFVSQQVSKIKREVEKQGKILKDWNISISYGVKTGFNKAFVISRAKKDELIDEDPKSAEIIKPLLRGRDIKKFFPDFNDLWLIGTFPSRNYNIEDYPAIRNYLTSFGKRLEQTGEKGSRKKTSNKWFETQDNIAYWQDFEKPKIIYPNMTKFLPFVIDINTHYYHNDKSFHINTDRIYWLGAFLNSKLFKFCFRDNFPELLGGTRELRKVFFDKIPVKEISEEQEQPFKERVTKILYLKNLDKNADISSLEAEIDRMVYDLYGLTEEEVRIVEGSFG